MCSKSDTTSCPVEQLLCTSTGVLENVINNPIATSKSKPNGKKFRGASTYNTKFNPKWTEKYPCIVLDEKSDLCFWCLSCNRSISCKHQGLTDVERHLKTFTHKKFDGRRYIATKSESSVDEKKRKRKFPITEKTLHTNMPVVVEEIPAQVIPKLCRHYYHLGSMTGGGGALAMKHDSKIYITPSGVEKEKITGEDLLVADEDGRLLKAAESNPDLKMSSCLPNFLHIFKMRNAGAALHLHSKTAVLTTILFDDTHFRITDIQNIKGIKNALTGENMKMTDILSVPIIKNEESEDQIQVGLAEALHKNPESHAILIRKHGLYVWGKDWKETKLMCENFEYIFDVANNMKLHVVNPL